MATISIQNEPSRVELELALRAAVLQASPREHGRERARRTTDLLLRGLLGVACLVGAWDLLLLASA